MNSTRKMKTVVLAISLAGFLLTGIRITSAATLSLSPASGNYTVGATIPVKIIVSSMDQSVNAVSGTLSFPTDRFSVVLISKTGSLMNFWATEPVFSNSSGTVHFEGIILNPGFTGSSGNILTIYFKVLATGTRSIIYSDGSVLANDGKGTPVLKGTEGATFSLVQSELPAPSKTEQVAAPATFSVDVAKRDDQTDPIINLIFTSKSANDVDHFEVSLDNGTSNSTKSATYASPPLLPGTHTFTVKAVYVGGQMLVSGAEVAVTALASPSIKDHTESMLEHEYLTVTGSSTAGTDIVLYLKDEHGNVVSQKTVIDSRGGFALTWPVKLAPGTYSYYIEAEDGRGARSLPTSDMQLVVHAEAIAAWSQDVMPYISIGIILIVILFGLAIATLYMWYTLKGIKQRMARKASLVEDSVHQAFRLLIQDIRDHIEAMQSASTERALSDEENSFIKKMSDGLKDAENTLSKKIEDISKRS